LAIVPVYTITSPLFSLFSRSLQSVLLWSLKLYQQHNTVKPALYSIQRPLGPAPKVGIPYISTPIKRPPPLKDISWLTRGHLMPVSLLLTTSVFFARTGLLLRWSDGEFSVKWLCCSLN
jgi:hypothetical protein